MDMRRGRVFATAASGVSLSHEPIRFEDVLERLRLGYWTMLREGSLRQDLEVTLPALSASYARLQRIILEPTACRPIM
jgi:adenine deaminase